jgi:hypothetical protein
MLNYVLVGSICLFIGAVIGVFSAAAVLLGSDRETPKKDDDLHRRPPSC